MPAAKISPPPSGVSRALRSRTAALMNLLKWSLSVLMVDPFRRQRSCEEETRFSAVTISMDARRLPATEGSAVTWMLFFSRRPRVRSQLTVAISPATVSVVGTGSKPMRVSLKTPSSPTYANLRPSAENFGARI
jgi:hypothetical protein